MSPVRLTSFVRLGLILVVCGSSARVDAATLRVRVTDPTGAAVPAAALRLENVASGTEQTANSAADGSFAFEGLMAGSYRLSARSAGFSEEARFFKVESAEDAIESEVRLSVGNLSTSVTVTAARNLRDSQVIPLRAETLGAAELNRDNPVSTGDFLVRAPGISLVSNGPFQVRPRLRGLDSTRVLILADGERLNNARTATDRAGVEVGLVDPSEIERVEIVSGSGSVLYGTDALSGTINILTRQPSPGEAWRLTGGARGYYSTNEEGRRGTLTLGASGPRFGARLSASKEDFHDYRSGSPFGESSASLFTDGTLHRSDTIDDNFPPFRFDAFPDPFNAPFTRDSDVVPNSASEASNVSATVVAEPTDDQTLTLRYSRRHAQNVGFADFQPPLFFQGIRLPFSKLDKWSAQYQVRNLTPWFASLRATAYYQVQDRKLENIDVPVQFPAPTPRTFFPINVFRLLINSSTEQEVKTPGIDVQGSFLLSPRNVLTAGFTVYEDRSHDSRTSTSGTYLVGNVSLGARGPQANVFPEPMLLAQSPTTFPTRVPDASLRDVGVFVQDEWDLTSQLHVVAGARFDSYRVTTEPTPGYNVAPVIAGAVPAIDPSTLPNPDGDRISRSAFTGDLGAVYKLNERTSIIAHYGRSYRHPNLEELLFAGPATAGNIAPNINVKPEKGDNLDLGVKIRSGRVSEQISYFRNTYHGLISQEFVATLPGNSFLAQAVNFSKVRIQGVEAEVDVPFAVGGALFTAFASGAYTHGQVLDATNPLTGEPLDDTPQDNISPLKVMSGLRVTDRRGRLWAEYGNRIQKKVERVSALLTGSPFAIAQDYFGLNGFTLHRIAAGYNWNVRGYDAGLTLALENLGDRFFREQFQFAPARGRSFTVGLRLERR